MSTNLPLYLRVRPWRSFLVGITVMAVLVAVWGDRPLELPALDRKTPFVLGGVCPVLVAVLVVQLLDGTGDWLEEVAPRPLARWHTAVFWGALVAAGTVSALAAASSLGPGGALVAVRNILLLTSMAAVVRWVGSTRTASLVVLVSSAVIFMFDTTSGGQVAPWALTSRPPDDIAAAVAAAVAVAIATALVAAGPLRRLKIR